MVKIYTKTGDKGQTQLFGGGKVPKSSKYLSAYGSVDELNSYLGLIASYLERSAIKAKSKKLITEQLSELQSTLLVLGSDIASPLYLNPKLKTVRITSAPVKKLEKLIDKMESELPALRNFILPGGDILAAVTQVARTICRRAERETVKLSQNEEINQEAIVFLNRLSDYLFVLARYFNYLLGKGEVIWSPRLPKRKK